MQAKKENAVKLVAGFVFPKALPEGLESSRLRIDVAFSVSSPLTQVLCVPIGWGAVVLCTSALHSPCQLCEA